MEEILFYLQNSTVVHPHRGNVFFLPNEPASIRPDAQLMHLSCCNSIRLVVLAFSMTKTVDIKKIAAHLFGNPVCVFSDAAMTFPPDIKN